MLNIYRSRESIDKEKFIYDNCSGRTIVIVPDQYTLAAERQAMNRLNSDVLLDVEVTGISRLGTKLIDEAGSSGNTVINQYGRHMLISRILKELDDELVAFRGYSKKETFIEAINDFISHAKQHEISSESFMELREKNTANGEKSGSLVFAHKLNDLAKIFQRYQEKLDGKYTDNEDLIDLYIQAISNSQTISKSTIWFYGFDSYTPKNVRFIIALAKRAKDVNIHLIHDDESRDEDLFHLSDRMTKTLIKSAETEGIDFSVNDVRDDKYRIRRPDDLRYLEREIFSVGSRPFEAEPTGIDVFRCPNMYSEAEAAAAHVLRLLREENYRFSDIVIICNDQEVGGPIIGRVFSEYGMDIFDDKKRDALGSPVAAYVLAILEILAFGYRTPDMMRLLKTGLTGIADEDIDELENYVTKYSIKGSMWTKPFTRGLHEPKYADGKLAEIESTRQMLMSIIEPVKEVFEDSKTYGEFADKYREILSTDYEGIIKISLSDQIERLIEKQNEAGLREQAETTGQMCDIVDNLFNQITEIMSDESFDGRSFAELLRSGLSQLEVGVLPPTADDILLGTMQRTRSGDCKALIVIGANDGMIPRNAEENILFSPEELELLSNDEKQMGMDSDLRLMEENLAIYRNLSKPLEHLWLSYSMVGLSGEELRPSEIIRSIHKIFPNLKEKDAPTNTNNIKGYIGGHLNTLRHYTDAKRMQGMNPEDLDAHFTWRVVEEWLSETDDEILGRVKRALAFDNRQTPLPSEIASGLYSKYVNDSGEYVYRFSPTSLEKYSRCPFSFFMSYGIRPEELRRDEVGSRDIGDLYHNTLQRFMETVGESKDENPWDNITRDESDSLIERLAGEWADEYRGHLFKKSESEEYRFNRAVKVCKFIGWTLVEQARAGRIKKSLFETGFGTSAELKPIIKKIDGGTAYIQGKIDRIDILDDGRVKIIDYKTGAESLDLNEVRGGYRLQLMLYMQAAQESIRKPAGVFYFLIKEPELQLKGADSSDEKFEEKLRDTYRMDGIIIDNDKVLREIAGDLFDEEGEPLASSSSKVVKLRRTGKGNLDSRYTKNLMSEDDFGELQNTVDLIATRLCEDIADGKIDLTPKKYKKKTPCEYCDFKSICRFDTVFPGCRYEVI